MRAGAQAYGSAGARGRSYEVVVATGGRRWGGEAEADAFARGLVAEGVPAERVLRERLSCSTRENARFTARLLGARGIDRVALVTCDWHLARAAACFAREGLEVVERIGAPAPPAGARAVWRWGKERVLTALVALTLAGGVAGCAKGDGGPAPAADAGAGWSPVDLARAEDLRRSKDVTALVAAHDPRDAAMRRRAARALARIADGDATTGLLAALEDEDPTAAAWGAYGLGAACKGREAAHVRALAARAASFDADPDVGRTSPRDAVDLRVAIGRALGRCGGPIAEQVLATWVRRRDAWSTVAGYALGDVVGRGGRLSDDTMEALVDAAQGALPLESALYPFARLDRVPEGFAPRVAKAALAQKAPGVTRAIAVRALGRTGPGAVDDLARLVLDASLTPAERADAARALRNLDDAGHAAAAAALAQLVPDARDALALARLGEDDFGVLASLVASLGADGPAPPRARASDLPKSAEASLLTLAQLAAPGAPPPSLARRLAELRCGAAVAIAKGAYDAELLKKCDPDAGEAGERARLAVLLRRSLAGERKAAWRALTRSDHVKVREAALEGLAAHPELGELARAALAEGLGAKKGGIVATAAEVLHAHPDRAMVLADSERRAALDPSAPPPTAHPTEKVDPSVAAALRAALDRAWPEDLVEVRAAVLDAAVAVGLDGARSAATRACHDPNATMRERGARALRALGEAAPACLPDDGASAAGAPEIERPLAGDTRVVFSTDAGDLTVTFEPALTPIAAARFVALAKARFYDGIVVHRVVPGFVVQLGDPDGDGYGGAGTLLRCETSPVPFGPLDVGVALAGRDTGSSQIFVTLARWPHLDGEYARVGRAEGDWWRVAEGDVIRSVRVQE